MPFNGMRLRELRLRRALTLRDLGALAGLAYDNIHAIERGKHAPRPSTVRKLAAALGVAPDAFFDDEAFVLGKAAA
jgi:transcriptional regulator with XRE-family HTH domain